MTRKITYCTVALAGLAAPWFIDWRAGAIAVVVALFCMALVPTDHEERRDWYGLEKPPEAWKFSQSAPFRVVVERTLEEAIIIAIAIAVLVAACATAIRVFVAEAAEAAAKKVG